MSLVFKCPYCYYSSDWKSNLTGHVRRVHGDELADLPLSTPRLDRYCAKCDIHPKPEACESKHAESPTTFEERAKRLQKECSCVENLNQERISPSDTSLKIRRTTPAADASSASVARMSRLFKCPYCNYSSNKRTNLTLHVNGHKYCSNCDIHFTSNDNYQDHKEHYCSTRPVLESTSVAEASSASVARMSRILIKCPYCSYSSDWPALLSRHVRGVHGDSSWSARADELADLPLRTPRLDRYCAKCDIQFASYKNYQVHKEQYCSTRHVPEFIDSSSSPTPTQQLQQQQPQNQQHHPIAVPNQPRSPGSNSTTTAAISEYESKGVNMVLNKPLYAAISTSPLILVPCSHAAAGGGLSPGTGCILAGNMIIQYASTTTESNSVSQGGNVIPTYTTMPGTGVAEFNSVPSPVSGGQADENLQGESRQTLSE